MKVVSRVLLAVLVFGLLGCSNSSSPTSKLNPAKLSSEEEGARGVLTAILDPVSKDVVKLNAILTKASKAKEERNMGIADGHYAEANLILYKWRDSVVSWRNVSGAKLVYPESMHSIRDSIYALARLNLPSEDALTSLQVNEILNCLRQISTADIAFANEVSRRSSSPDLVQSKVSLNVSVDPFPFMLDILSGEFKVKQTFGLGPAKATLSAGVGKQRTGITTLILIHGGQKRVFAVGGRKLSFDVPRSHIEIDGKIMTITSLE